MKDIRMTIEKNDLLDMLSKYYTELLGEEIKVEARLETVCRGYGINEYEETEVNLYYTAKHPIGGAVIKVNNTLDENDVKIALNAILAKLGYTVEDYELKTASVGYGRDEDYTFDGLEAKVTRKGMQMTLDI